MLDGNGGGDRTLVIIGFLTTITTMIVQGYFKTIADRENREEAREQREAAALDLKLKLEAKALEIKTEVGKAVKIAESHATRIAGDIISATNLSTEASKDGAAKAQSAFHEANNANLKIEKTNLHIEKLAELVLALQKDQEGGK